MNFRALLSRFRRSAPASKTLTDAEWRAWMDSIAPNKPSANNPPCARREREATRQPTSH